MVAIRDTYSVEFNADQAVAMANKLAKAMDSLGRSLTNVKAGKMSELSKSLAVLDGGKIQSAMRGVEQLGKLNTAIVRMTLTAPKSADIQRITQSANQLKLVSNSMSQLGANLGGMSQFIAGLTSQVSGISKNFTKLQASFSTIGTINTSAVSKAFIGIMKAFDIKGIQKLGSSAKRFNSSMGGALPTIRQSVRSISKITEEMRKIGKFASSNSLKGVAFDSDTKTV